MGVSLLMFLGAVALNRRQNTYMPQSLVVITTIHLLMSITLTLLICLKNTLSIVRSINHIREYIKQLNLMEKLVFSGVILLLLLMVNLLVMGTVVHKGLMFKPLIGDLYWKDVFILFWIFIPYFVVFLCLIFEGQKQRSLPPSSSNLNLIEFNV